MIVAIQDLTILRGRLNPRAMGLVTEWAALRRKELFEALESGASSRVSGLGRITGIRMMLYQIVEVEARTRYRVWVRFEDGVEGEVDLSDLVGKGVFRHWEDEGEFEKVCVDSETGTIAWPGGIDLAPDALYEDVARLKAG